MNTYLAMLFLTVSQTYNLPPGLLRSVCYVETKHDARAISPDDKGSPSYGICQVKFPTARLLGFKGQPADLQKVDINVDIAGRYLRRQLLRYRGDIRKAISAYNSGTYRPGVSVRYARKVLIAWSENR